MGSLFSSATFLLFINKILSFSLHSEHVLYGNFVFLFSSDSKILLQLEHFNSFSKRVSSTFNDVFLILLQEIHTLYN